MIPHQTSLTRATILRRPNRFIVEALLESGETARAHCPVSGRIGGLTLDGLSILLSGPYEGRGTTYTVEAFATEDETSPTFQWIGINQSRCNVVVESLLKEEKLALAFPEANANTVRREKKLLDSRIDFLLDGKTFLEVKMPLLEVHAARPETVPVKSFGKGSPSDRLPKQLRAMGEAMAKGYRGAMLVVFQYENTSGTDFEEQLHGNIFPSDLKAAREAGLEVWVLRLSFHEEGLAFEELKKA